MKHIVVDLEMNNIKRKTPARKFSKMETIEIGAVMLDEDFNEISSFRTYVRPEYNDHIENKIVHLTGITDEMVCGAPKFNDALRMFTHWCLGMGDEVIVYSWSNNDYIQISNEMLLKHYEILEEEEVILKKEWSDFQNEFDLNLGFDRCLSLSLALDMAGIDFSGRQHDALDDAKNTAMLLQVVRDEELFALTLKKIKEAMEPSNISGTIGDMVDMSMFICA